MTASRMVLEYRSKELLTLEDIQKLTVKGLTEILRCYSELMGGVKEDLILKILCKICRQWGANGDGNKEVLQPVEDACKIANKEGEASVPPWWMGAYGQYSWTLSGLNLRFQKVS